MSRTAFLYRLYPSRAQERLLDATLKRAGASTTTVLLSARRPGKRNSDW